ncbi:hypothetical protein AAMO2058_001146400, partial [Amorphochlora amoebiformis]
MAGVRNQKDMSRRNTLRLSVYPQGNRSAMKAIAISTEASLADLVSATAKALRSQETHICLETGALIEDIALIRDEDILMLAKPPVEFKGNFANTDEKRNHHRNPGLPHPSSHCRAVSAQGWSGGPSITEIRPQTCHIMEEEQISHRHPLSSHRFVTKAGSAHGQSGGPSINPSRAGVPHQTHHMMSFQGRVQGYQNHLSHLPSPLPQEGLTGGHTHSPDVSQGNQAPTMGQHLPTRRNQGSVDHANEQQPSPMHVQAGGSIRVPRVNLPPLGSVMPNIVVNRQLPIVHERREIPGINLNHNNVLHHANYHASNATNLRYEQQASTFQEASTTYTQIGGIYRPDVDGKSRVPIGGTHVPNTAQRVNGAPQGAAADHSGVKRVTSSRGKKERNPPKRRRFPKSICHWCGSICKEGLARHIQEKCNDGLFRAACDVIRKMLGNGKMRVSKGDIKKAYVELMKRPEFKSELITRIREQMTDRVKATIRHTVRAPPSNVLGYKAFHG